jgi:uncharacterized membrane protein YhaH (DUF805 family)
MRPQGVRRLWIRSAEGAIVSSVTQRTGRNAHMDFGQAISSGFRNYARFGGTASRSEYWWWTLFVVLVSLALNVIDGISGQIGMGVLATLWSLGTLLPSLGLGVRRLRDAGFSWAYLFLFLIPFVGAIILIVLLCQPNTATAPTSYGRPTA